MRKLICAALAAFLVGAFALERSVAADVFELEPEHVYGKNRKPRLGYRKPEVFDPLSDQLYRAGIKDYPPIAIPDELREVDAMTRVQKMGHILACSDGWYWPLARTARKNEPPGIEIEILQAIAKKHGWEVDMSWTNTVTRFGHGAAFSRTIDKGICDVFLGLNITGDDDHMDKHQLVFTRPFMSTGFVLVTQRGAKGAKTLDDIKAQNIKLGVAAYSPMQDYAQAHGLNYATFFQNYQLIDAMLRGDLDAAMLWSGSISQARLEHPEAEFSMPKGYVPAPETRWNSAWGVKEKEKELKQFIDEAFAEMLKNGEIKRIVERYGMPFYPPTEQ